MLNQKNKYAPDVLDCIANLSNDEVFTSPKLANQMLDMVPQELFSNPRAKFLDPFCKSGVFLREIVKRLDRGLEDIIPDKQQRIDHILHKQVFGIAITELTAQLSRRTLYCSKHACAIKSDQIWISDDNDDKHGIHEAHSYSISEFTADDINNFCISPIQGNIRFDKTIKHDYSKGNTCLLCGANKNKNNENNHAYELIHISDKRLEELKNMKWDLIIGNPPYQLKDGGSDASATPLYNKFIEQAQKLQPRYLTMIIPSRWMKAGKGLDAFREKMINDTHIKEIHDFESPNTCFPGIPLDGGVCYFLWQESYNGKAKYIFEANNGDVVEDERYLKNDLSNVVIRDSRQVSILNKVFEKITDKFSKIVSSTKPYGIRKDLFNNPEKYPDSKLSDVPFKDSYLIRGVKGKKGGAKRTSGYISKEIVPDKIGIDQYKLFFTTSYSTNATIPPETIVAEPNEICTETFLMIGPFETIEERDNCNKYIHTSFFRTLLYFRRGSMQVNKSVFEYIPLQNFTNKSDIDWSKSLDEINLFLYKKYNFTENEINFIKSNIEGINLEINEED